MFLDDLGLLCIGARDIHEFSTIRHRRLKAGGQGAHGFSGARSRFDDEVFSLALRMQNGCNECILPGARGVRQEGHASSGWRVQKGFTWGESEATFAQSQAHLDDEPRGPGWQLRREIHAN